MEIRVIEGWWRSEDVEGWWRSGDIQDWWRRESPKQRCKTVLRKSKYDYVTPPLQELHWLPIKFRPQYKIAIFVYRFFDGSLPGYPSQTLCAYEPTRNLRSSYEKLLKVPKRNTKTFGERSFSFLAPSVWKSLPSDLRNSSYPSAV